MIANEVQSAPVAGMFEAWIDLQNTLNSLYQSYCDPATKEEVILSQWKQLADIRDRVSSEIDSFVHRTQDKQIESFCLGISTGLVLRAPNQRREFVSLEEMH